MRVAGLVRYARPSLRRDLETLAIWLTAFALVLFYAFGAHAQASPTPTPAPHVRKAFYYHLTPRQGGPSALVGPWNTLAACRDNLGSALYAHRNRCHLTGASIDCKPILGNGYAYLQSAPYPPPWQIPDGDCTLTPIVHTGQFHRYVRFWYGDDGSVTIVIRGRPHGSLPAGQFTYYANSACPNWPWIYIGDTGSSGGDGVCG